MDAKTLRAQLAQDPKTPRRAKEAGLSIDAYLDAATADALAGKPDETFSDWDWDGDEDPDEPVDFEAFDREYDEAERRGGSPAAAPPTRPPSDRFSSGKGRPALVRPPATGPANLQGSQGGASQRVAPTKKPGSHG